MGIQAKMLNEDGFVENNMASCQKPETMDKRKVCFGEPKTKKANWLFQPMVAWCGDPVTPDRRKTVLQGS